MKLTFEQTPADLTDLWKNNFRQRKGYQIIAVLFLLLVVFKIGNYLVNSVTVWKDILTWLITLTLIGGIWYFLLKRMRKQQASGENGQLITGYREVTFLDEGIFYKTEVSETKFSWGAVTTMSQSSKNYFLYMGKQRAIIIPKSAFLTENEQGQFLALMDSKLKFDP